MPRFKRMQVLSTIYEQGLVAIFIHPDPDSAIRIAAACAQGDFAAITARVAQMLAWIREARL